MTSYSLNRRVNLLGGVALASYAAIAVLSYFQTPALWNPVYYPNAASAFSALYGADDYNAIVAFFDGPLSVILSRWIPLIIATCAAIGVIAAVRDIDRRKDNVVAPRILLWSLAFAGVSVLAYPLYTQDLWLSALWGDMVASGANPYHVKFTGEMTKAFPLDHFPMTMSYGPLWALLSALVMLIAGGSLITSFLLFKLVLAAAWCATLFLVDKLAVEFAPRRRSLALAIAGWLPLGVLQTVAEGHNDIFLVMPVLLWLALLIGRKASAPLALGASVLSKYATAPLFLADAIHAFRQERLSFRQYCLRMVLPAVMFFGLMAIFYRSFAFFDGVRLIGTWQFMHPDDAFGAVAAVLGSWIAPAGKILLMIFPAIAAWQCWKYWQTPTNEMLLKLVLTILGAVSFSAVSHLWPWYLVWTLPVAALIPQWRVSRFIIAMCVIMPFSFLVWWVPAMEELNNAAALAMYAAAALWAFAPMRDAEGTAVRLPANVRTFRGRAEGIGGDRSATGHFAEAEGTVTLKKSA